MVVTRPYPIAIEPITAHAVLAEITALGDANSKSLGFLPFAGFRAAATQGHIALARRSDGSVAGYCLFDLPRDIIRVVQLCISDDARQSGLARSLIDAVSTKHADRLGMVLKCRADWPADSLWPRLGFTAQTQVTGRSKQGHPLTVWWRSHGHDDLFTLLDRARSDRRAVALDSNVYSDLHSAKRRPGSQHSAVIAPLIADDKVNVVLLPTLQAEIYKTKDADERKRFLNAQLNYTRLDGAATEYVLDDLLQDVPERLRDQDPSLEQDARLIAEAHANGVDMYVTRDKNALMYLAEAAERHGVVALHPAEVPTFLHAEAGDIAYRPAQLEETTFITKRLDRGLSPEELDLLLDKAAGERIKDLRDLVAGLAGRATSDVVRTAVYDGSGVLQAVWATMVNQDRLEVPFLRVGRGDLQVTVARQVAHLLRESAVQGGQHVIRVTDPYLHGGVIAALQDAGFDGGEEGLTALAIPTVGAWAEVSAVAQSLADQAGGELARFLELPESPSMAQTAEFERLWAPAKIIDQGISNFLVPIKPQFSSQLLGYPASLMNRADDLGLSREHVYYCNRAGPVRSPARVLWYVSGKEHGAVFASSNLLDVVTDTPARLHRRFCRLGVWRQADIESAASNGKAAALLISETELFSRPVTLDLLRALWPDGRSLLLRSAQRVTDESYERIYKEGVRR
ncbi:PIN domain-containing protein [Nocardioides ultimimeridianus]